LRVTIAAPAVGSEICCACLVPSLVDGRPIIP